MSKYKFLDVVQHGPLFDMVDGEVMTQVVENGVRVRPALGIGPDSYATHKNRDKVLIAYCRQYGEVLVKGLAPPRDMGQGLIDLADEAEAIEKEVPFGYNL